MEDAQEGQPGEITVLLRRARGGEPRAMDELFRVVYDDLRVMAKAALRSGGFGRVGLDGTAVVNAACARLLGRDQLDAQDRRHFFFLLSRAMHDVLVDEVRQAMAAKRGGKLKRFELHDTVDQHTDSGSGARWDVMDLHEALTEFRKKEPECAQVVELRFFAGRTLAETAELLEMTVDKVRGNWDYAKAWLGDRLSESRPGRDAS